jgi:DNA-binding MarR family transcriptional regulator
VVQPELTLSQLLGDARRWFDDALIMGLGKAGAAPVSATQAGLFAVLDAEGTTVSELARRMGVTRQTAHQTVQALTRVGLLEQVPDPSSGRRRLVRRTPEGERAHQTAIGVLRRAETALARRIGKDSVQALRTALRADWGRPPS